MKIGKAVRYWYQPKAAREFLLEFCNHDEVLRHGLAHLLFGTLTQDRHESLLEGIRVRVQVPFYVWDEIGIHPSDIEALGILQPGWKAYRHTSQPEECYCRRFAVDPAFVLIYLRVCLNHIDDDWCNLIDGSTSHCRRFEREGKGKSKKGRPRRTYRCMINWKAGTRVAYRLLEKAEAISNKHHRARAIQAIRCLLAIRGNPTFRHSSKQSGYASYVPTYHQVDCGGRWYEEGAGFQGLPGVVKAALLQGTGNQNYDLRSCHIAAAVALAGEINAHAAYVGDDWIRIEGMSASPVEREQGIYGVRDLIKAKKVYDLIAAKVGLPRKVVKIAVLSILYGGNASSGAWKDKRGKNRAGAVMQALLDHHGGDFLNARASHRRLMPLLVHVEAFARSLETMLSLVIDDPAWWRRCRDRLRQMIQVGYRGMLVNAVGTRIEVCGGRTQGEKRANVRRALSHILTGIEQQVISMILRRCDEYGVTVLNLEHDGIITDRPIPREAIEDALQRSLLANYTDLDVKSLEIDDHDEIDEVLERIQAGAGVRSGGIELVATNPSLPPSAS